MTRGATHRFIPNPLTADQAGRISGTIVLDEATGNEAALTLNYTTNKATSGNDTGLLINQTDTASPGTSKQLDIQVGGVTKVYFSSQSGILSVDGIVQGTKFQDIANSIYYCDPSSASVFAGSLVVGGATVNPNAILDVQSTTKAFMPPRMTQAQRDAIAVPTAGMMIYNSDTNVLNFYNGAAWGAV